MARSLGASRWPLARDITLPLARPAIAAGLALALLEALNDIGASEFLGVRTLTVSIYSTWVTRSDLVGAAQMAMAMLAIVVTLIVVEWRARQGRRYEDDVRQARPFTAMRLGGWRAVAALVVTSIPVVAGFALPGAYLVDATAKRLAFAPLSAALIRETATTFTIAAIVAALATVAGVAVAYARHLHRGALTAALTRISTLGYALPGTVLAIGVLPVLTLVDDGVDRTGQLLGTSWTIFTLGTGAGLIYACVVRFLAMSVGTVEAGLGRVSASIDDAARTLGAYTGRRLFRIHLPLTRPAVVTGALLVFVDCMKELPATLLLRPIGVETLATHLYGEAVRGTYEDGAVAALLIVAAGLLPVIVLARSSRGRSSATSPWQRVS
jgi:iron(III) transport system permease protein